MTEEPSFAVLGATMDRKRREAEAELESIRAEIKQERENWEKEKESLRNYVLWEEMVYLNVGGKKFETFHSTLVKFPGTPLAAMFSGAYEITADKDGRFFLDFDGKAFEYILEFLKTGVMVWPDAASMTRRVLRLAELLRIDQLRPFSASSILSPRPELRPIMRSLFDDVDDTRLLFKATQDGFSSEIFKRKVEGIENTVLLVRVGSDVFGGFKSITWNSKLRSDQYCFIFSLKNPEGRLLGVKIPGNGGPHLLGYYEGCPTIGNEICFSPTLSCSSCWNDAFDVSNLDIDCGFFCGSCEFQPDEIEVFAVNPQWAPTMSLSTPHLDLDLNRTPPFTQKSQPPEPQQQGQRKRRQEDEENEDIVEEVDDEAVIEVDSSSGMPFGRTHQKAGSNSKKRKTTK